MGHRIDKSKVEEELIKRGWRRGLYMEWLTPSTSIPHSFEEDWTAAILIGIVCELEDRIVENKKFLADHTSNKRQM